MARTFIGSARVPGTSFRLKVMEGSEMNGSNLVKAAAAGAVVTAAVVTITVLWFGKDASKPKAIEAGQKGLAREGSLEVVSMEDVVKAREEKEAAILEKETLAREKAEIEKKLETVSAELGVFREKEKEARKAAEDDRHLAISFGDWGEVEGIEDAKWREMGEAAAKITEMAKEIVAAETDEELMKLGIRAAGENQKLVPLAVSMNGKFPTHAPGNGEFTHPMLHWNLLAERLEIAGVPLTRAQVERIGKLGNEYDAEWERLQERYTGETFMLEKLLDELEIKKTFTDRLEGLLTRKQRDAVVDPDIHHILMVDVHSPMLIIAGRADPLQVSSKEELREAATRKWNGYWELDAAFWKEPGAAALGEWAEDVDSRLTPLLKKDVRWIHYDDAIIAGRAQVRLMRSLLALQDLPESSRGKISGAGGFLVPRLVTK